MDLRFMASFPFLDDAINYMKSHPHEFADIKELAMDVMYEGVREKSMERIHCALDRVEIPIDFHSDEDCRVEVLSYILARILVAATNDTLLIRWYSLSEAVRSQKLLNRTSQDVVQRIAQSLGMNVDTENEGIIKIGFIDYLKYSSGLKSFDWKLANQPISRGRISINREKLIRLIMEALKIKFEKELCEMKIPDDIKRLFGDQLGEIMGITARIKESYERQVTSVIIPHRFPPCIHQFIASTKAGENVPHSGRFAMTTFLVHIGMSIDEIVSLFSSSPDFREDLARYQVEHIAGEISGTNYESMSCKTMVTYGLCVGKDKLCERINHPLSYYDAKNDDALPEDERRLRRGLAGSIEIAKVLKMPLKSIQIVVLQWFKDTAIVEQPSDQGVVVETATPEEENQKDEVGGSEATNGRGDIETDSSSIDATTKKEHGVKNRIKQKTLDQTHPVSYFNKAANDTPVLFQLKVARAWLTGIKVTHPASMEDRYLISTTGTLEDNSGKIIRMLPVLDYTHGKILRDFQKTWKEILVYGQIFNIKGRKFIHVINVELPP